jgi:hypothetical protein
MSRDYPLRFVGSPDPRKRTPYTGNKNPSQQEYAIEGYSTLALADCSDPYDCEDRDYVNKNKDADYDDMKVR